MSWYHNAQWAKIRSAKLSIDPLCAMCQAMGKATPATVVDHIIPHAGDWQLFTAIDNLQSLCATCHGVKRTEEHTGYSHAVDVDGNPIDPRHPWNLRG